MKQQAGYFTPAALTLSVVTAALADGIPQGVPVRRALWLGAVSTVCLCILSALAAAALLNKAPSFAVRLALTAGLFMELAHIIVQAQGLCAAEFSSMALLGFLPLLLWVGWRIRPASWNASARVLWWFVAVGGVVCLLGLAGQLHWYRLFTSAQPTATGWSVPVYAEYFAGALLCSAQSVQRAVGAAHGLAAGMGLCSAGGGLAGRRFAVWKRRIPPVGAAAGVERRQLFPHGCAAFAAVVAVRCLPGGHAVCRHPLALAAAGS